LGPAEVARLKPARAAAIRGARAGLERATWPTFGV